MFNSKVPWTEQVPSIFIDSRETASGIPQLLVEREILDVKVQQLEIGDYIIADLCIERKTGDDFEKSLMDGRLFRQLLLLKRAFRRRSLIIEGKFSGTIPTRGVAGAIIRISAGLQIPILYSKDPVDTVAMLQRAALQLYGFTTSSFHSPLRSARTDYPFHQVYVLAGIPGIGVHRARRLIENFGSLRQVMNASRDQLAAVEGIGPVQAELIEKLSLYDRNLKTTL
jgi:ERCC4-type nuclease